MKRSGTFVNTFGEASWSQVVHERRANIVNRYLVRQCNGPIRRILPTSEMGTFHEAALIAVY
jgi:hypothetical protein